MSGKLSFEEADLMYRGAMYAIVTYHHKYSDWEVRNEVSTMLQEATGWTLEELASAKPSLSSEEREHLKTLWEKTEL